MKHFKQEHRTTLKDQSFVNKQKLIKVNGGCSCTCHLSTHVKLTEIVESLLLKEAIHFHIHQTISFAGFNDITCHHTSGLIMLQKTEVENLKVKIKRSVVCDHTDNKDSINWRVKVSTLFFLILRARGHMLFFSVGRKMLR